MKAPKTLATETSQRSAWLPWFIWILGGFVFGYGFFQRVAPGVMVDSLMRDFAVGGAVVGNLSAVYFFTYAVTQVPAGLIVDAYGSRRMLVVSATCLTVGSLIFAEAQSLLQAYLGRLLVGLGAGATFVIALNLAAVWFPRKRFELVSGLTFTFGVLGSLMGQTPLAWGVEGFGWRAAMHAATLISLAACIGTWFTLRPERPVPRTPAKMNMAANLRAVLARRDTWVLTLCGLGTMSIMLTFGGLWGVPWLVQVHGFTRPEAALALTLNSVAWGVGAPALGWVLGRFGGRKRLFLAATACSLACYGGLILTPGLSGAAVFALLIGQGLGTGAIVLVFTGAHERFAGGQEGAAVGIVNTGIMIGAGTFQPLIGWILDLNWKGAEALGARIYDADAYQAGLSVLIGSGALAVLAGLIMPEGPAENRDQPAD